MALKPVAIIMGSQSDWATMKHAAKTLDALGIGYEACIVSAHRTPKRLYDFAGSARKNGFKVIIAGAGGAAHLPGMLASVTPLPVIGVPVPLKHLDGLDSLLSMVQMPAGVPVATVAIGNARNAGLLAVRGRCADRAAGLRRRRPVHRDDAVRRADRGHRLRGGPSRMSRAPSARRRRPRARTVARQ